MIRLRAAALALAIALPGIATAQTEAETPLGRLEAERARSEEALREARTRAGVSADTERRLAGEAADLQADRAKLAAALVEAAARHRETEEKVAASEDRIAEYRRRAQDVAQSLETRRGALTEVLAALQRMNRRDGPAILIRADDILAAVRASLVLGTVLPGLKQDVETVAADLAALVRLRADTAAEQAALGRERDSLAVETRRLAILGAYRRQQLAAVETDLGAERDRAAAFGREAESLQDLVARLEQEIDAARRGTEDARRAREAEIRTVRDRIAAATLGEAPRLAPRLPFAQARGSVARPVSGPVRREFGAGDGQGGTARGILIAAPSGAVVTAPADGWVAYAGPFRTYGRLLIINAGGGYYLLLAGLGRIGVDVGQFVLSGEPVGQMGGTVSASAASGDVEAGETGLYVEFRKDGGPIDPSPWWVRSHGEKARG